MLTVALSYTRISNKSQIAVELAMVQITAR